MHSQESQVGEMEIKKLTGEQVVMIYSHNMIKDFPVAELKPLAMINDSLQKGTYECLGALEGEEILAYAFMIKLGNDYLLDYFAVEESHRGEGIGSAFLQQVTGWYDTADSMIAEVEDYDYAADAAEEKLRRSRYGFYLQNGYQDTKVRVCMYGVEYIIMECSRQTHTMEEIKDLYSRHYRNILPAKFYDAYIKIK